MVSEIIYCILTVNLIFNETTILRALMNVHFIFYVILFHREEQAFLLSLSSQIPFCGIIFVVKAMRSNSCTRIFH